MLRLATSDGVQNVTGKSPMTRRSYNQAPTAFGMHYGCPKSNTDLILNDAGKKSQNHTFQNFRNTMTGFHSNYRTVCKKTF